jgi:hypothetical protein
MTSTHTIKYESSSSHNKICSDMIATSIIISLYKQFSRVLSHCENQGVTNIPRSHTLCLSLRRRPCRYDCLNDSGMADAT